MDPLFRWARLTPCRPPFDLDGDGAFDGGEGGDADFSLSLVSGPGIPLVGDWNGDGIADVGKVVGDRNQFVLDYDGARAVT